MTKEELLEEAIHHLADHHCVLVDCKEIKEPSYCPMHEEITCEQCWKWYLEDGSWWDREIEPDYDRAWKEMHGE